MKGQAIMKMRMIMTVAMTMMMMMMVMTSTEGDFKIQKNSAVVFGKVMFAGHVNYTHPINKLCECRMVCYVMPRCRYASAVNRTTHFECLVSYGDFSYSNLERSDGGNTFYWHPEYQMIGQSYYQLYRAQGKWFPSRDHCLVEGGQLAILNTPERISEVTDILDAAGINEAWIGLFSGVYSLADNNPQWQYRGGAVSPAPKAVIVAATRCFYLKLDGSIWILTNAEKSCYIPLAYICQRDH